MSDTSDTPADEPDISGLADVLASEGADGYLIDAASDDSDQRYLSGFDAPDPFVSLFAENGVHLLVPALEYGRARTESRAATVSRLADFDYRTKRDEYDPEAARHRVVADFLAAHDVSSIAVPPRFPVGTADGLRDLGVSVRAEGDGAIAELRATKTAREIEAIRVAQRANERAMAAGEDLLAAATVADDGEDTGEDDGDSGGGENDDNDEDGVLYYDGEALTAERVKREIEVTLLEADHTLDETIVACGTDAADPHNRGSGPLRANEAIIVDIFPRGKASKYHADMTRTFCVGEPSPEVSRRYELTSEALNAGLDAISAGTTGEAVHDAVCDVYEEAGYATLRSDDRTETGFIHSTGHSVGLDVHELPQLASGGEELEAGNVITVEPGLYDPDIGGVRIEDLVVVTEDGYENLTDYPKRLIVD